MPIINAFQTDSVLIDETFQVRGEQVAIRIPVAREIMAQPDGRRAVARQLAHSVVESLVQRGTHRGEAQHLLDQNMTYVLLAQGRDPRDEHVDQAHVNRANRYQRGQWAEGTLQGYQPEFPGRVEWAGENVQTPRLNALLNQPTPIFWGNHENIRIALHTTTNAPVRVDTPVRFETLDEPVNHGLDDMVNRARARARAKEREAEMEPCACGQRFNDDDEPNPAWEHGPDECTFVERPVDQFVDHGRD